MRTYLLLFIITGLVVSCSTDPVSTMQSRDLLQYGIPMTIRTPDSVDVKTMDFKVQKDVSIKGKGEENYFVQIVSSSAATTDVLKIKADQMVQVKEHPFFSKVVMEEESGFIYENKIDSNSLNYGFRYIRVQGDMEYIFQTGLIGTFTQSDVEMMYEAVKPGGK